MQIMVERYDECVFRHDLGGCNISKGKVGHVNGCKVEYDDLGVDEIEDFPKECPLLKRDCIVGCKGL